MPSSRQTRAIREAIARDATPLEALFRDKSFLSIRRERLSPHRAAEVLSSNRLWEAGWPYLPLMTRVLKTCDLIR
jgi:hypothetical protein